MACLCGLWRLVIDGAGGLGSQRFTASEDDSRDRHRNRMWALAFELCATYAFMFAVHFNAFFKTSARAANTKHTRTLSVLCTNDV